MAALLLDIVSFLVSKSLVTSDGVDAFRDFTPEQPDDLVVLHEYAGDPASLYDTAVHRSVQILARSKRADSARLKSLSIFKSIQEAQDGAGRIQLTDERCGQVYLRQSPFRLKTDENNRAYYAFNIGITTTTE